MNLEKINSLKKKITSRFIKIKDSFISLFVVEFPGKKMLMIFKAFKFFGSVILIVMIGTSFCTSSSSDSSYYEKAQFEKTEQDIDIDQKTLSLESRIQVKGLNYGKQTSYDEEVTASQKKRSINLNYKATQVINRIDEMTSKSLPTGASALGKLLTNIDSRSESGKLIRVLLSNGINFNGKNILPKKTILLGQSAYPSKGARVFIGFSLAILPDGKEIQIQASALDYKDFSPGIAGQYHSAFKNRVAATAGLSFLTGFSETLQEREVLGGQDPSMQGFNSGFGGFNQVTKKATLKNAMLSGLSEFSKAEGAIQLQELQSNGPYVIIKAGLPLIITLNQTLSLEGS